MFTGLHWDIDDDQLIIREVTDGVQTSFCFKADGNLNIIVSDTDETKTVFNGTIPEFIKEFG